MRRSGARRSRSSRRAGGAERVTTFADGGRAALALYQDGDGARLGWRVLAPVTSSEVYDAIVDAGTGAVVRRNNRVDFATRQGVRVEPARLDARPTCRSPVALARRDDAQRTVRARLRRPDRPRATRQPRAARRGRGHGLGRRADRRRPAAGPGLHARRAVHLGRRRRRARGRPTATRARRSSSTSSTPSATTSRSCRSASTGSATTTPSSRRRSTEPRSSTTRTTVNNASFLTLPDGEPAHLQVHLFSHVNSPYGDYDGANDASLVFHEYTHGLSNRLVTDAQGFGALNTEQAGAIGEGTSDFYALDYLVGRGLDRRTTRRRRTCGSATYLDDAPDGLRAPGDRHAGGGGPDLRATSPGPRCTPTARSGRRRCGTCARRSGSSRRARSITEALRLVAARAVVPRHAQRDPARARRTTTARLGGVRCARAWATSPRPTAAATSRRSPTTARRRRATSWAPCSGTVRDDDGQPLAGAHVGIAGHDTQGRGGLGPELAADTGAAGDYQFAAPAGPYPLVIARARGPPRGARRGRDRGRRGARERRLHARARLVLGRQRRVGRALHRTGQQRQRLRAGRADRRPGGRGVGQRAHGGRPGDRDRPRRAHRRRGRGDRSRRRLRRRPDGRAARLRGARLDRPRRRARARSGFPARSPPTPAARCRTSRASPPRACAT